VFEVALVGAHNVKNSLAAMAVAFDVGVSEERMRSGLAAFAGVKRRLEIVGEASGVTVFDDFAHHPTAVKETLLAVRSAYPDRRVWAVFEPRSASSCRRVFQAAFTEAFALADETVLAPVFRSSLPPDQRLSTEQLVRDLEAAGKRARHLPSIEAMVDAISAEARDGDLVVCMSNGSFGGIHGKLVKGLEARG
jgi:UDP-N-acetylmuramate: L-alanyl-gamma-D-glutamyl-meso-diaminopimelate ligase